MSTVSGATEAWIFFMLTLVVGLTSTAEVSGDERSAQPLRKRIVVLAEAHGSDAMDRRLEAAADWLSRTLNDCPDIVASTVADPLDPPVASRSLHRTDPPEDSWGDERPSNDGPPRAALAERARRLEGLHAEYLVVLSVPVGESAEASVWVETPRDLGDPPAPLPRRPTLRIADGRSGQVLFSTRIQSLDRADMQRGADRLTTWLAPRPWRGQVVEVDWPHQRILLSAGRAHGLDTGRELSVLTDGEPILDPDTGDELGETSVTIGRISVVSVFETESEATIVEGCEAISAGDRVVPVMP